MYYRRKILLKTIDKFGGKLDAISLQKLLFLLSKHQIKASYEFIPYKYGCFSFQAQQDLNTLQKYGHIASSENYWTLTLDLDELDWKFRGRDLEKIDQLYDCFRNYTSNDLIEYTYKKHPYYAINSSISEKVLDIDQLALVNEKRPTQISPAFFTIGYEGITLEAFLNRLIVQNVKLLCDVRRNAKSMKYGFSKKQLEKACNGVGIAYVHIPELGIASEKRRSLDCQDDYDELFLEYDDYLNASTKWLLILKQLFETHNRIAITCFEKCVNQCHRGRIASKINNSEDWGIEVVHL